MIPPDLDAIRQRLETTYSQIGHMGTRLKVMRQDTSALLDENSQLRAALLALRDEMRKTAEWQEYETVSPNQLKGFAERLTVILGED